MTLRNDISTFVALWGHVARTTKRGVLYNGSKMMLIYASPFRGGPNIRYYGPFSCPNEANGWGCKLAHLDLDDGGYFIERDEVPGGRELRRPPESHEEMKREFV